MTDHPRILSARRAYEFAPDELRLTVLSNASFVQHFQEAFDFGEAAIDRPSPTFGSVPATSPPGLVFVYGSVTVGSGLAVPIRYIHFEAQRLVIDIAGPSEAIASVYMAIRTMLAETKAPDGYPVLGEPVQMLDYSDIVAQLDVSPSAMLNVEIGQLIAEASGESADGHAMIAVPRLEIHVRPTDAPFRPTPPHRQFRLTLRPGTTLAERRFLSGAPLDTTAHIAMLQGLERVLGGGAKRRRSARAAIPPPKD